MREMLTAVEKIEAAPGQRILVVSDVHGHFNHLVQLLRKLEYGGDDILVIVGDLIEKGPESLRAVLYECLIYLNQFPDSFLLTFLPFCHIIKTRNEFLTVQS